MSMKGLRADGDRVKPVLVGGRKVAAAKAGTRMVPVVGVPVGVVEEDDRFEVKSDESD